MNLDDDLCYRAMESRDRRFEGAFVIGVRTTGIYCRPGCPARIPHRKNVRFFADPAAAQEAGHRPCLRCRPDASPGSPAWLGTPATVTRALRLIDEGVLAEQGVGALADRLGVGERHLRRLFDEHLGAAPLSVDLTRRAHFARKLIEETSLPVSRIAFAAGFRSLRRFNDAMQAAFAQAPRALRRSVTSSPAAPSAVTPDGELTLTLAYRLPFDFESLLTFLKAHAIPGVERVDEGVYARTISGGTLEVRNEPDVRRPHLRVTVRTRETAGLYGVAARVRALFDLDAAPEAIHAHLSRDPFLSAHLQPGLRVPGAWDGFELAVRAVIGQQISVVGATTLSGRLVAQFGEPVASPRPGLTHLFPSAATLRKADLSSFGMPRARCDTLTALARAVDDGAIDLTGARSLDDSLAALVALPGIGSWTASYVAMRAGRDPDALPEGDLALRKMMTASKGSTLPSLGAVRAAAEPWRPWRAYAAIALWKSYVDGAARGE